MPRYFLTAHGEQQPTKFRVKKGYRFTTLVDDACPLRFPVSNRPNTMFHDPDIMRRLFTAPKAFTLAADTGLPHARVRAYAPGENMPDISLQFGRDGREMMGIYPVHGNKFTLSDNVLTNTRAYAFDPADKGHVAVARSMLARGASQRNVLTTVLDARLRGIRNAKRVLLPTDGLLSELQNLIPPGEYVVATCLSTPKSIRAAKSDATKRFGASNPQNPFVKKRAMQALRKRRDLKEKGGSVAGKSAVARIIGDIQTQKISKNLRPKASRFLPGAHLKAMVRANGHVNVVPEVMYPGNAPDAPPLVYAYLKKRGYIRADGTNGRKGISKRVLVNAWAFAESSK